MTNKFEAAMLSFHSSGLSLVKIPLFNKYFRRVQPAEAFMMAYLKHGRDMVVGVCGFRNMNQSWLWDNRFR
jgi:hypothetical protein